MSEKESGAQGSGLTRSAAPSPAPGGGEPGKSALAKSAASLGGRMDNNGALMGVAGAKFQDSTQQKEPDAKGGLVAGKPDEDAGEPARPVNGAPPSAQDDHGAGASYKAMAVKLELQRKADAEHAARLEAEKTKHWVVEQIMHGNADPNLRTQLAKINTEFLNLPPTHTGY